MTTNPSAYHRLWSVILAGNEPSALDPFIKLWQGVPTPKSFFSFVGTRSLLQHTWDLADQFSHPESKVTVVTQPFLQQTFRQFGGRVPGLIATEPFHKGSLASALIGLAAVHAQDPQSTLAFFPSQAFIYPEQNFLRTIQRAVWAAKLLHDRVVIFGASSEHSVGKFGCLRPTEHLGWTSGLPVQALEIGNTPTFPVQSTSSPSRSHSDKLLNSGVLLAKTEILWNVCERRVSCDHSLPGKTRQSERTAREIQPENDKFPRAPDRVLLEGFSSKNSESFMYGRNRGGYLE